MEKRCHFVGLNRNDCRNGSNCPFFHDVTYEPNIQKKERKIRKKQYKESTKYFEYMQKVFNGSCIYFNSPTGCYKGDDCPFLHSYQYISPPQLIPDEKVIPH